MDEEKLTWANLLSHWDEIETDFHHFFGVDFGSRILADRRWRWFTIRLVRLLSEDTAIARCLGLRDRPNQQE
ncbi:conserved hypothetical protein [Corynebacterium striatum]|nr:conserved hypothetical protein [Corynebacterium striatum]